MRHIPRNPEKRQPNARDGHTLHTAGGCRAPAAGIRSQNLQRAAEADHTGQAVLLVHDRQGLEPVLGQQFDGLVLFRVGCDRDQPGGLNVGEALLRRAGEQVADAHHPLQHVLPIHHIHIIDDFQVDRLIPQMLPGGGRGQAPAEIGSGYHAAGGLSG
jgi:hypothetical protein